MAGAIQERFDELAKGLATKRLSRRQVLKSFVAGALLATPLGALWNRGPSGLTAEAQALDTTTYSAVGDFSPAQIPSPFPQPGVWSYGYQASSGSGFTLYTIHSNPWGPDFDQWSLDGNPPHVTYNRKGATATFSTITQPADVLNLHPGPAGQKSVVRWTAPFSGTVRIEGRFQGIDTHGTTTDVAIVHNSTETLFNSSVNGYGAKVPFSITRSVSAGDTIDFSVGYGSNANYFNDSTGLSVSIT